MINHTPGPWIANGNEIAAPEFNGGIATYYVRVASMDDTRETGWNAPTIKANARLIAAAPDLLAALQDIVEYLGEDVDNGLDELLTNARAAIATAKGQ